MLVSELAKELGIQSRTVRDLMRSLDMEEHRFMDGSKSVIDITPKQADAIRGYYLLKDNKQIEQKEVITSNKDETNIKTINPYDFQAMADIFQSMANIADREAFECGGKDEFSSDYIISLLDNSDVLGLIASLFRWFEYRTDRWDEDTFCIGEDGEIYTIQIKRTNTKIDLSKSLDDMTKDEQKEMYSAVNKATEYVNKKSIELTLEQREVLPKVLMKILCGERVDLQFDTEKPLIQLLFQLLGVDLGEEATVSFMNVVGDYKRFNRKNDEKSFQMSLQRVLKKAEKEELPKIKVDNELQEELNQSKENKSDSIKLENTFVDDDIL